MEARGIVGLLQFYWRSSKRTFRRLFADHKSSMGGVVLLFGASMFGSPQSTSVPESSSTINKVKSYIVEQIPELQWTPETVQRWRPYIKREAEKRNIDPRIPEIIVTLESGGDPRAESWVGAKGLMQIMPATGADIARRLGVKNYDLNNPETNIAFGTFYIAERMQRFQDYTDDIAELVRLSAIGYNGGDGRTFNYLKGLSIPRESRIYSDYAHRMWKERNAVKSAAYDEWYTDGHGYVLVNAAKKYQGTIPDEL